MRIGLIGVGRIGAFHAQTLAGPPGGRRAGHHRRRPRPRATGRGAPRRHGSSPSRPTCSPRASTASSSPPRPPRTPTSSEPACEPGSRPSARSRSPRTCRRRPSRCATSSRAAARRSRSASRAGSTPPSWRPGPTWPAGDPRIRPHRAVDDAGPGAAAGGLHPRIGRHLQRLRDPRLRRRPVRHRAGGRRGVRGGHEPGRRLHRGGRRRRVRHLRPHAERRHSRRRLQQPVQRPRPRRPPGAARQQGLRGRGPGRPPAAAVGRPGVAFPAGTPWDFFLDRFADAFRAELAAFTEVVAGTRPSPCTLARRRRGVARSPRPPRAPGVSTGRFASTRSADSPRER